MGILKFADKNEVVRYSTDDGEDWIDLRASLTKGEMNSLFNSMPDSLVEQAMVKGDDGESLGAVVLIKDAPEMSKALFKAYAKAWSLNEPWTVESYLELDPDAAAWVDEQISTHSNESDKRMSAQEGKSQPTSRKASRKATAEKR